MLRSMKNQRAKGQVGFTIVELLVVIVVIAILATISIVSYSGVQNRANDTVVRSDISNFGKKLQIFEIDNARYPETVSELNANLGSVPSKSYTIHFNALHYCYNPADNTVAVGGVSKSGAGFLYKNGALTQIAGWPETGAVSICTSQFGFPMPSGSYTAWRNPNLATWDDVYVVP